MKTSSKRYLRELSRCEVRLTRDGHRVRPVNALKTRQRTLRLCHLEDPSQLLLLTRTTPSSLAPCEERVDTISTPPENRKTVEKLWKDQGRDLTTFHQTRDKAPCLGSALLSRSRYDTTRSSSSTPHITTPKTRCRAMDHIRPPRAARGSDLRPTPAMLAAPQATLQRAQRWCPWSTRRLRSLTTPPALSF